MKITRRSFFLGLMGVLTGLQGGCRRLTRTHRESWLSKLPEARREAIGAAMDVVLPGALAAGSLEYLEYWLEREPFSFHQRRFDLAGLLLNRHAQNRCGQRYAECNDADKLAVLKQVQITKTTSFDGASFFDWLVRLTLESFLGDPKYGGNRDRVGWKLIGWKPCWWSPSKLDPIVDASAALPY